MEPWEPKAFNSVSPMTVKFSAKAQYGVKMPEGSSPTKAGQIAAQVAAGMFWPYAVDQYAYKIGGEATLKLSATLKFDMAGNINWMMVGTQFNKLWVDMYVSFSPDKWVTWFFNDTGLFNANTHLVKTTAYLLKSESTIARGAGRILNAAIALKETEGTALKIQNQLGVNN